MKAVIYGGKLKGEVAAIASKSMAHRYMIAASLADRDSFVECRSTSDDIEATVQCLSGIGAGITRKTTGYFVSPADRTKLAGNLLLPCGESGSTFRFLLPVAAALGKRTEFVLKGRLPERPLSPLYEEMTGHGVHMSTKGSNPFICEGCLRPGKYQLSGNVTSQFISGLLFALPLLDGDSEIILTSALESEMYVEMTLAVLKEFGITVIKEKNVYKVKGGQSYRAPDFEQAEGDWSNAAFWLCAGAISGGPVSVTGLKQNSIQGDRQITGLLESFGAKVGCSKAADGRPDRVTAASESSLHKTDIDASDIPDLVPILAAVAAYSEGRTTIYNARRLRLKESDRLSTVTDTLRTLGADIAMTEDSLVIDGKRRLKGGAVSSCNDHRIAMMAAVAAIGCEDKVIIEDAEAVNKSYPTFFEDYKLLGGRVECS